MSDGDAPPAEPAPPLPEEGRTRAADVPGWRRPTTLGVVVLAVLAYVPALIAAPGRMPADSKLYLYLDPGRLMADAAGTFDPRQFAGWFPHQHVAYLWPSGPWFWVFDTIFVPDWIAHRLWIGTLLLAAGLGARWCARQLGLAPLAALVAALVYQVSPYVLPYVSRTSVMLLPWAGLGWIVALTIRACRSSGWRDPALIALTVMTVGAVNATALAMIVPGPVLWLVHAVWSHLTPWRSAVGVALRTGLLSVAVSVWWLVALVVQGRYGADVLRYSETLADVSHTATSAEVWRGLGYWLFYIRDPFTAATTESLRYLQSTWSIALSYAVPVVCLVGLALVRWVHRRFAVLLVATGAILAIGVHPHDDRSPLVDLLTGGGDDGLALALRSSTRALPVMNLGLALAAGALVASSASVRWKGRSAGGLVAIGVSTLVLLNLPGMWTGAFVDPSLERDQDPPDAWLDAAAELNARDPDRDGDGSERVVMLPGAEFGAYRWGYTVDQPLPGLTEVDVVTRDLLPLGSPPAMDLWFAFDDRLQDGAGESESIADVARLFAADTVWLTNDLADDRFATARPEVVRDVVLGSDAVVGVSPFGDRTPNVRQIAPVDGRAVADPRIGEPHATVELVELDVDADLARAYEHAIVLAGSGDGVVDAAAAALLDDDVAIVYGATERPSGAGDDTVVGVLVTDSNRDRDRHWRSSQDTTGFTESGGGGHDLLSPPPPPSRLDVFGDLDDAVSAAGTGDPTDTTVRAEVEEAALQTIALQRGPVQAAATAYGEPFALTPEDRAVMAIDGDRSTAWTVAEHADPVSEAIELRFPSGSPTGTLVLHQAGRQGDRRITSIEVTEGSPSGWSSETTRTVTLDPGAGDDAGDAIALRPDTTAVRIEIQAVGGGAPGTAGAVAAVGFTELDVGLGPTTEVVRPPLPPHDLDRGLPYGAVLTRLRTDPMDPWRSDPEPTMIRELVLPEARTFEPVYTIRLDARAPDADLAALFGWPVVASTRLTGSLRSVGAAAFDGDATSAWTSSFGDSVGASISVRSVPAPVASIRLQQPTDQTSPIREIEVRSGAETRFVNLEPDANGSSVFELDPPLPAGDLEIEITAIEPAYTVDRRYGDVVELPAAISELEFDGAPRIDVGGAEPIVRECVRVADVDGAPVRATITIDDGWIDGDPLAVVPCDPSITLDAGRHVLSGDAGMFQLDRLVLDDELASSIASVPDRPDVSPLTRERFGGRYEVGGCPTGCWFTFGEGYSEGWSASVGGVDLGPPVLVDGGFNGWWIAPTSETFEIDVAWTAQRPLTIAIVASLLAAALCVVLVRRGRSDDEPQPTSPVFTWRRPPLRRRQAAIAALTWVILGGLFGGLFGAVLGAIGGFLLLWSRRRDLAPLVALASLVVVAGYVIVNERRWMPLPNGGWPIQFERVHELGVFATVALLVGAVVADDERAVETDDDRGVDRPREHADGEPVAPLPSRS